MVEKLFSKIFSFDDVDPERVAAVKKASFFLFSLINLCKFLIKQRQA